MLAELTLLLHEMTDSLRRKAAATAAAPSAAGPRAITAIHVSGLASPGKARLVAALQRRLSRAQIPVSTADDYVDGQIPLHVHAESDIEAMVEGPMQWAPANAAMGAAVIVPVDWEPIERSVTRIVALIDAGATDGARIGA